MDPHASPDPSEVSTIAPDLPPVARAVAMFTRPAQAWTGLERRAQWWIPALFMMLINVASVLALHHRALVPMLVDQWEQQVDSGRMTNEQVDRIRTFMESPVGMVVTAVQQAVILPVLLLISALLIWFGVGFVLGTNMKYRLALEVAAWSWLITLPAILLTSVLAWSKETMRGIHVGFGIVLPEPETPTKLSTFLGAVLDALGPLAIWYLVVVILGAAALSGAPRKSTAWVLGGLYLAATLLLAGLGSMFVPTG